MMMMKKRKKKRMMMRLRNKVGRKVRKEVGKVQRKVRQGRSQAVKATRNHGRRRVMGMATVRVAP